MSDPIPVELVAVEALPLQLLTGLFLGPPGPPGPPGVGLVDGDKGDITVSAAGATWTIDNGSVTLAKQADVAAGSLFYRKTAGTGAPEVQPLATLKADLGLTGTNTGDQTITLTGDVTGSGTTSVPSTISNSAVIGKVLTGFTSGAGAISAVDTILQAIQKLNGNDAAFLTSATAASTYQPLDGDLTSIAALTTTTFGRSFLDRADATAGRTLLGLGTAATTAATDYATAAQGVDSREWTASTISQAEAETGTSTTRRAWTAERVRQAAAAWWLTASSTLGRTLANVADAAAGRTALGLGGASTLNVGTSAGTVAAGDDSRITGALSSSAAASTYLTIANGAATYQPLDSDLTSIAALTTTTFGRSQLTLADAAAGTAQFNLFTASLKGLAPASGGGTTNFLRADGTWVAPAGGGSVTSVNITPPAAGINASGGPITGNGSITLFLTNDLAAVEALSSTGIVRRTGADTWSAGTAVNLALEVTGILPGSSLGGAYTAAGLTMATSRLLGRTTAATGAAEEIVLGTNLSFTGTTLNAASGVTNLSIANRGVSTLDILSDTGTDVTVPAATTSLTGLMVSADKTKLDGVATGATANSSDATLLARANHTGTQAGSTVTGAYTASGMTMTTARILGRTTAAAGAVEEISIGSSLSLSGGVLNLGGTPALGTPASGTLTNCTGLPAAGVTGLGSLATQSVLGNITNVGAIGSTSGLPIITTASGVLTAGAFGTGAGSFCAGNDSRVTGALDAATAASTYQPLDGDLTSIAALTTTTFGRSFLDRADATAGRTLLGLGSLATQSGTFSGSSSGTNTGDQTITLTGEASGSGTGSFGVTLSNAGVIGKVLTGYTSGAGTVAGTDSILQAIQKLNGNDAAFLTSATAATTYQPLDGDLTSIAALTTTTFGRSQLTLADAAAGTAQFDLFTASLKGLTPASGGGTTNFLRADGTWAAPAGGGGGSSPTITTHTLNFGTSAAFTSTFIITPTATIGQSVLVSPAYSNGDELEFDSFICAASVTATNQVTIIVTAAPGPVVGTRDFTLLVFP